jgi:hypothetical protein
MYRLPITSAFEWDVVIVKVDDILKGLQTRIFNYYYVISRTCDHSQTERYLLKIHQHNFLFSLTVIAPAQ